MVSKSDLDKLNKLLDSERKKYAQAINLHEKQLLAVKKNEDKTKAERAELEVKVNGLSLENKKLLLRKELSELFIYLPVLTRAELCRFWTRMRTLRQFYFLA